MDFIYDPSLVLYLPLYQLDGASFVSKDAHGHLCSVTGALWRPNGRYFDGVDDYIVCGDGSQLSFGATTYDNPFSLLIWANVTDISAHRDLITKEDLGNTKREYYFQYLIGGTYRLGLLDQSVNKQAARVAGTDPATTGEMTLYSATYDGGGGATAADGITLYINGATIASTASNDALYVAMEPFTDVPLYIGNRVDLDVDLLGTVGEVWIYSRVLTPLEIQRIYLATKWRYR